jgi:hypothetical protein
MRENRPTIDESMATMLDIEGREQLVQHISMRLAEQGVAVTDDMIHVSHYGFDERIEWDEYIIVVDRFGVFGFTDGPCPIAAIPAGSPSRQAIAATAQHLFSAETESAYGQTK